MNQKEGQIQKAPAGLGPEEMAEINQYTRRVYQPEEVYAFSLVLCDNQVDRDNERFAVESLETLRKLFLGKTCIFDHERKSANQTARIYRTGLERCPGQTTQAGEELVRLTARAYLPRTSGSQEVIELIESGILKEVSVSCSVKRKVCSLCGKEHCQHKMGESYGGKPAHWVLLEPTDAYECSFVAVPAQRGAGVLKRFGGEDRRLAPLRKEAELGRKYLAELRREVVRLAMLADDQLDGAIFARAAERMEEPELLELRGAYAAQAAKRFPAAPQLRPRPAGERDRESAFRV